MTLHLIANLARRNGWATDHDNDGAAVTCYHPDNGWHVGVLEDHPGVYTLEVHHPARQIQHTMTRAGYPEVRLALTDPEQVAGLLELAVHLLAEVTGTIDLRTDTAA